MYVYEFVCVVYACACIYMCMLVFLIRSFSIPNGAGKYLVARGYIYTFYCHGVTTGHCVIL